MDLFGCLLRSLDLFKQKMHRKPSKTPHQFHFGVLEIGMLMLDLLSKEEIGVWSFHFSFIFFTSVTRNCDQLAHKHCCGLVFQLHNMRLYDCICRLLVQPTS